MYRQAPKWIPMESPDSQLSSVSISDSQLSIGEKNGTWGHINKKLWGFWKFIKNHAEIKKFDWEYSWKINKIHKNHEKSAKIMILGICTILHNLHNFATLAPLQSQHLLVVVSLDSFRKMLVIFYVFQIVSEISPRSACFKIFV